MNENRIIEDLKKTNAILAGIIESSENVIIFALDNRYRYTTFNSNHKNTMKKIWGVDIKLGKNMIDYIKNEEDRQKAENNFARTLAGESFSIEEQYGSSDLERRYYQNIYNPIRDESNNIIGLTLILTDITERKKIEIERDRLIEELQNALEKVKQLSGLLPVCSNCKKIRDDNNHWQPIENYIYEHSEAQFSHSLCPDCAKKLYPDLNLDSVDF